jgi:hypothetical protein
MQREASFYSLQLQLQSTAEAASVNPVDSCYDLTVSLSRHCSERDAQGYIHVVKPKWN